MVPNQQLGKGENAVELMQEGADDRLIFVQVAFPDGATARQAAQRLVAMRLVACAQETPIMSTYRWDEKVEETPEIMLTLKTVMKQAGAVEAFIRSNHPYDEPEFLILPALGASTGYAKWVRDSVGTA